VRAPHPIQWLADNGSVYAAAKPIEIATALNLTPCFTPVESPESNGVAEAPLAFRLFMTSTRWFYRLIPPCSTNVATTSDAAGAARRIGKPWSVTLSAGAGVSAQRSASH